MKDESLDSAVFKHLKREMTEEEEAEIDIREAMEAMKSVKRTPGLLPWEEKPEVM